MRTLQGWGDESSHQVHVAKTETTRANQRLSAELQRWHVSTAPKLKDRQRFTIAMWANQTWLESPAPVVADLNSFEI